MILQIVAYGDPILRKQAEVIASDYPEFTTFIKNMFDTMDGADGVGLAAPQVGKSIRLFVVDGTPFAQDEEDKEQAVILEMFRKAFINPQIIEKWGDEWAFNEGCLSVPGINENVMRPEYIKIRYMDEQFNEREETYCGKAARIIQHEYDHLEGKVFTDYLSPLKKRLLQNKLQGISNGNANHHYPMRFPSLNLKKKK